MSDSHTDARPEVTLQIGSETFTGGVEVIGDRATIEHVPAAPGR